MTVVASWSGEGLTDGTSVGTGTTGSGDTAFDTVTASTFTVDTTGLHSPRIQVDQQASTEAQLVWDDGTLGTLGAHAVRMYVELSAWPGGNARILHAYDASNALQWWMDVTSSGILRLRDPGGSAVDTSTSGLPTDDEFRIEVTGDGTGAVTVNLYDGDSTTAFDTLSGTGLGTTVQQIRVGTPSTSPTWPRWWVDEIAVADDDTEIGPVAGAAKSGTGAITAVSSLSGSGSKAVAGTGAITAAASLSGAGSKAVGGTGSITATSSLSGTGRGETPGPVVELNLGGTWTDVSSYVRYSQRITITRGRRDEGSATLDTSTCALTLGNSDGRFSPRHPDSPYYGLLGRNTPIRVSVPYGSSYLRVPGGSRDAARVTCPDAAGFDVTDLDVRVDLFAHSWGESDLCGRYETTGNQRSWWFGIDVSGAPRLIWSPDGTLASRIGVSATEPLPAGAARRAVRATLDVDNGASGYDVKFWTADSIDGSWTQLGDTITGASTTAVYAATVGLEVGDVADLTGAAAAGYYFAFQLLDGIGGDVVAEADFTALDPGDTGFTDSAGNTWTVGDDVEVSDRLWRFHGEVAEWPPKRDISGADATVSITATGISRRLKQGEQTLRSTMFRAHTNPALTSVKAYWPCEDGEEATSIASGRPGDPPMRIEGAPALADYDNWTASGAMPTLNTGRFSGTVAPYSAGDEAMIYMFVFVDEAPAAETSLLKVTTTGTARTWEIRLLTNGNLRTKAWGADGAPLTDSSSHGLGDEVAFQLLPRGFLMLKLQLVQDGSDIDWETSIIDFTNTDTINTSLTTSGFADTTVTGKTIGRVSRVIVGAEQGVGGTKVSHIVVSDDVDRWLSGVARAIAAWNGEAPIARMTRLCQEEEIPFAQVTDASLTDVVTMGDQLDKTLLDLLEEAAASEGGVLYEDRDQLGLGYRPRRSMYNQVPVLTLSCDDHELTEALEPVDDDQRTLNDVTVKREAGSSVRVEQASGPLSTDAPPDGVGRYDTTVTLSLEDDGQLADQASWRLHLGTVDEARYPRVKVNLAHPAFDDELTAAALAVDIGDRLVITDPSSDLPPDDISQLVIGYSEVIDQFEHVITYVCQPESPWRVGVVEFEGFDRLDTGGSTLAADATSSATSLSVASTGALWTTDADDLPMDVMVGGERMTVTAVSGTSSPQTFTVTRAVNGVQKTHSSGDGVAIAEPVYVAL